MPPPQPAGTDASGRPTVSPSQPNETQIGRKEVEVFTQQHCVNGFFVAEDKSLAIMVFDASKGRLLEGDPNASNLHDDQGFPQPEEEALEPEGTSTRRPQRAASVIQPRHPLQNRWS